MRRIFVIAFRLTIVTLVLTGVAYPLAMTAVARIAFPAKAAGSLVVRADGTIAGSALVGQPFARPEFFHPRPSAAGAGYDATASSGSNLGPTSKALRERAAAEIARLRAENPHAPLPIPADLVTASASGLDPHISVEAALWQVPRVALARRVDEENLRRLVMAHVEGRTFGVLGEPRVNVLALNLALDAK